MSHVSPSHKNKCLTMRAAILLFIWGGEGNINRMSRRSIKQPQRERNRKIFRLGIMKSGLRIWRMRNGYKKEECIDEVCFIILLLLLLLLLSSSSSSLCHNFYVSYLATPVTWFAFIIVWGAKQICLWPPPPLHTYIVLSVPAFGFLTKWDPYFYAHNDMQV